MASTKTLKTLTAWDVSALEKALENAIAQGVVERICGGRLLGALQNADTGRLAQRGAS